MEQNSGNSKGYVPSREGGIFVAGGVVERFDVGCTAAADSLDFSLQTRLPRIVPVSIFWGPI